MVLDSDLPQLQIRTVECSKTCPSPGKLFNLGSRSSKHGGASDAKTLVARRKRAEIRRFKLMATACDEAGEPLPKRSRGMLPNGLNSDMKVVCDGAGEQGFDVPMLEMSGRCQPEDANSACSAGVMPGAVLMEGMCMNACAHGLRDACIGCKQEQMGHEDDIVGAKVQSRLDAPATFSNPGCLEHCVVSICGRSREMEDAAVAAPSFLSLPSSTTEQAGLAHTTSFHMYGVFDGHGGSQAAKICEEKMARALAEQMNAAGDYSPAGWETCMQSCFQRLDGELCGTCPHGSECPQNTSSSSSCREPLVPGSVGTTAVVTVVGADAVIVANCGDSRAVLCRGGQAVPLSSDHKASRPDEVARIEAAGGSVFNWQGHRVCGVLAMSRALGDSYLKPYVIGLPEVTVTARSDEDECLILASDGLWDVLSNELVCSVARKVLAGGRGQHSNFQNRYPLFALNPKQHDLEQQQLNCGSAGAEESPSQVLAALLTKLALAKQSKDNISVIVVDLRRT